MIMFQISGFFKKTMEAPRPWTKLKKGQSTIQEITPLIVKVCFFSQNNNKTPISVGGIPVNRNVMFLSLSLYRVEHKAVSK